MADVFRLAEFDLARDVRHDVMLVNVNIRHPVRGGGASFKIKSGGGVGGTNGQNPELFRLDKKTERITDLLT